MVDIFTEKCSLWKAKGEAVEREREAEPDEERQRALQEGMYAVFKGGENPGARVHWGFSLPQLVVVHE